MSCLVSSKVVMFGGSTGQAAVLPSKDSESPPALQAPLAGRRETHASSAACSIVAAGISLIHHPCHQDRPAVVLFQPLSNHERHELQRRQNNGALRLPVVSVRSVRALPTASRDLQEAVATKVVSPLRDVAELTDDQAESLVPWWTGSQVADHLRPARRSRAPG